MAPEPRSGPLPVLMVQRKCACGRAHAGGEECCEHCRRSAGRATAPAVHEIVGEPGRPLDPATRGPMEARFGWDFSGVRVHDDGRAAQSAAAIGARAYTVGSHVVFGPGARESGSPAEHRLLAHELAHVVQQARGGHGGSLQHKAASLVGPAEPGHMESEADAAERAVAGEGPMPSLTAAAPGVARDEAPGGTPADATARADAAEAGCDIATLCNLRWRAPKVVNEARVRRVFSVCHPEISPMRLVGGDPCMTLNLGLPAQAAPAGPRPEGPAPGPRVDPRQPQPPQQGGAGGSAPSSGGISLPSTSIKFSLGPAAFTVDLPASLSMRLPIEFRGKSVVIALGASPSEFSFTITLNAVPHVRIIAGAKAKPSGEGSAGLTIETTRTICRAMDAASARSALQSAGEELRDAILAVQNPPTIPADANVLEETFDLQIRLGKVAAAVANVNSTIDKVKAKCKEEPVASFNFGVQGPLAPPGPPIPGTQPTPSFLGGALRLHF